jgi:hypothetical protein
MKRITGAVALLVWSLVAFSFPPLAWSADFTPTVKSEVVHLLSYIRQSGCQFNRNGEWYGDADGVCGHIQTKCDYFLKKGKISSTEDFIKWSASKSEMSGKPYLVRCGNGPTLPLSQWLTQEIDRYRRSGK